MRKIMANRFATYEQARDAYVNAVVPLYGATRLDWGFGRWLYLDFNVVDGNKLSYWLELDKIGILTTDGRKRFRREMDAAAKKAAANDGASPEPCAAQSEKGE